MSRYRTKADLSFKHKQAAALEARDFEEVARLNFLYGCYLELIEPTPVEKVKAIRIMEADENDVRLPAAKAAFCYDHIGIDPMTLQNIDYERFPNYAAFYRRYVLGQDDTKSISA